MLSEIKTKIQNKPFYQISRVWCLSKYHIDFVRNFKLSDIDKYMLLLTTDKERIFLAYIYCDVLHKQINVNVIYSFLRNNKIPCDIYILIVFFIQKYNINTDEFIEEIIKDIDNIMYISYMIIYDLIPDIYKQTILNKIVSLIYTTKEIQVINKCFVNQYSIISILAIVEFEEDNLTEFLRSTIITLLFDCNTIIEKHITTLKTYFEEYLMYVPAFVKLCCFNNLITKNFINKVFNTNKECFKIIKRYCNQYKDYINALDLINTLEDDKS